MRERNFFYNIFIDSIFSKDYNKENIDLNKFEFYAHLKNENSQKRSHKMVMKGRITYE